jgi:hydroxymethylbilane synthase
LRLNQLKLIVGTRGSKLSLIQTSSFVEGLKRCNPEVEVQTKIIHTTGDKLESEPLEKISGKGVFEKEIDEAVINGEVDFAVHSMKDVPAEQSSELTIAAVPKRAPANDVFISKKYSKLVSLPKDASVGTSSPRRTAELLRFRPDLKVLPIRGNVDTRIRKMDEGMYDSIILAQAGVIRMGMQDRIVECLSIEEFTPAPGQGFLAVISRNNRDDVLNILRTVSDGNSFAEAQAERAFMNEVGGGCKIPLGAFAYVQGRTIRILGSIISPDGSKRVNVREDGPMDDSESVGRNAAKKILNMGAKEIVDSWNRS